MVALDKLAVKFAVDVEHSCPVAAEELAHIHAVGSNFAQVVQMHTDCLHPEQHIDYFPDMHTGALVAEKCLDRLPAAEVANN